MRISEHVLIAATLTAVCGGLPACASSPPRPTRLEDEARSLAPVPACLATLPGPRKKTGGMSVSLRDEYWKIVFPSFDDRKHTLPPNALACTGKQLLSEEHVRDTRLVGELTDGEITLGSGADGIKPVWLRSHRAEDGTEAGAVALVRARDDQAYVIGVGWYRGRPKARLALDRLGNELTLSIHDDGCTGRDAKVPCSTTMTVYLVRQGRLVQGEKLALEQVDFASDGESGARGKLQFHLTASPSFVKDTLNVVEHISVVDETGREVRWAELERRFLVIGDRLEAGDTSLWSRFFRPAVAQR